MKLLARFYLQLILLYFIAFGFYACNETELPDDNFNASQNFNRTIIFDVNRIYDISPLMDSTVQDVKIDIYLSYEELAYDYYPEATRTTDENGHAEINGLDKDYYYIKATHPILGILIDSVTTPANTTSFVMLTYY